MFRAVKLATVALLLAYGQLASGGYKSEVTEFGYYTKISEPTRYRNYSSTSGYVTQGGDVRLSEQTNRIPIEKNRLFGFKFKISGFGDLKAAQFNLVVKHPEIIRPNGSKSSEYTYPVILDINDGVVENQTGYSLDHDYELVEGKWIFEIWLAKEKLISQTFETFRVSNQ